MQRIEKKLAFFIEKHIVKIAAFWITVAAFFVRRVVIVWQSDSVWMDSEVVLTPFYRLLLRFTGLIAEATHTGTRSAVLIAELISEYPIQPIHLIEWLAIFSDLIVAFLCICILGEKKKDSVRNLLIYIGCMMGPLAYIRGAVMGELDSFGMVFLLLSYRSWIHEKKGWAFLWALIGITVYLPYFLVVIFFLWVQEKKTEDRNWLAAIMIFVGSIFLQGLCGLWLSGNFMDGVRGMVSWIKYRPYSGEEYVYLMEWLLQMAGYYSYAVAMVLGFQFIRRKISSFRFLFEYFLLCLIQGMQYV